MKVAIDRQTESLCDLDVVLTRLEAKVDALPTKEWIRAMMVREVARTTALAAVVAIVGTLAFPLAG